MSFNIRGYVSDDHVESIGEIAKSQSAIIQVLSLDNSQKNKEIERLNKVNKEIFEANATLVEEIERLKEKIKYSNGELNRYKSIVWLCEKVKDCDKSE